ncbi:MAG: hypothetical protein ACI9MR_000769 [Myxococcota bacterium]|jgi:hypothetical protein
MMTTTHKHSRFSPGLGGPAAALRMAALGLCTLAVAACDDGEGSPPTGMSVALYSAPNTADPFQGVSFIRLLVTGDGLDAPIEQLVPYERGGGADLDGIDFTGPGQTRQLTIEGWAANSAGQPVNLISRGRSRPAAIPEGGSGVMFDVLMARVNSFVPLVSADTLAEQRMVESRVGLAATQNAVGEIVVSGGGTVSTAGSMWWAGGFDRVTSGVEAIGLDSHEVGQRSSMLEARAWHTATAVGSGQVIMAGGYGATGLPLNSVELYNPPGVVGGAPLPISNPLAVPRAAHSATLIDPTQRLILFVGGDAQGTWELWDPINGTRGAQPLPDAKSRRHHAAETFFLPGRTEPAVLIAGGEDNSGVHATSMLFDSVARTMVPVAEVMPAGGRTQLTATYVPDRGFIYVVGGYTDTTRANATPGIDVFEVATQRFIPNNAGFRMRTARGGHGASLMPNNTVVITGGGGSEPVGTAARPLGSIEVIHEFIDVVNAELRIEVASSFNPETQNLAVPFMPTERLGHRSVALDNGMTLLVGGATMDPTSGDFVMVPSLSAYNPQ